MSTIKIFTKLSNLLFVAAILLGLISAAGRASGFCPDSAGIDDYAYGDVASFPRVF
ncbi:MAG: hypothetical protein M0C28_10360 [Candidatus Moduliflexus flocculans]|nr:hypothetical protein [Candidatus Moduliflexus flocculans]